MDKATRSGFLGSIIRVILSVSRSQVPLLRRLPPNEASRLLRARRLCSAIGRG